MADFIIRKMQKDDIPFIFEIEKSCFSNPWSERSLLEECDNPNAHFLVYEKNGIICGYIGSIFVCDEASVTNVAVLPDFRRQGIGMELISALILEARKEGQAQIFLEVRLSNSAAQSLYQKCGFENCGIRRNFYSAPIEDAVIMQLTL